MRKRDSIEFLWDELKSFLPENYTVDESVKILSIFKQAKAMHKVEIVNAVDGFPIHARHMDGEEYYNETYESNP